MAEYYSAEYTAATTLPSGKKLRNGLNDQVIFKQFTVVIPDAAVADELVFVTPELPVGTYVDPTRSQVVCSADPGTGELAIDVGIVTENDLATEIDLAAGGIVAFNGVAKVATTAAAPYVKAKLEILSGTVGAVTLTFDLAFRGGNT